MSGAPDTQAGDHPFAITTTLSFPQGEIVEGTARSIQAPKDLEIELPAGLVGNPQAAPRCTIAAVFAETCPSSSRVGTLFANFAQPPLYTSESASGYPIYNVVPERGYPAEFGVFIEGINKAALLYGSVGPPPEYRLHISSPDIPVSGNISNVVVTFFGDPQGMDGGANPSVAFITNPSDCSGAPLVTNVLARTWEEPDAPPVEPLTPVALAPVAGCQLLRFEPSISLTPETTLADEPSGYTVDARFPQASQGLGGLATPPVKNTTVTFPQGLTLNPSAGDGLVACPAEGPEGIDLSLAGSGHCPLASQAGTVEAVTPLLSEPLEGHVYVAMPGCGGSNQRPCEGADAADGNLYGLYLQLEGSGVVLKLHGTVSANPANGQLTGSFMETPQQPVSDLKLIFKGGPRARCKPSVLRRNAYYADMTPWSSPETLDAHPSFAFSITGCGGSPFFTFLSGGHDWYLRWGITNFSLTLGRTDPARRILGALQVQTPPGLLAMRSHVTLCGEPQAARDECSLAAQIGIATAGAGAGSHPFWVSGPVYLTGPTREHRSDFPLRFPQWQGPLTWGRS